MSAATRLPAVAGVLTVGGAVIALWKTPAVQKFVAERIGGSVASTLLKVLAAAIALANLKNLPGMWHVRVLRSISHQLYFQKRNALPKHLFAPLITHSYNTIWDCDYNIHKSNSTYFADLDVARAHTVGAIIRTGLARLNSGDTQGIPQSHIESKGKYVVALGAVSCFFHRQIEPLESFEIYTRVLTWDRKWLYIVSHIVKKGAIKPDSYVLQPWKNARNKAAAEKKQQEEGDRTKYIFASSLARYVFKKGRMTINPEIILERSRLLPARPERIGFPPRAERDASSTTATFVTPTTPAVVNGPAEEIVVGEELDSKLAGLKGTEGTQDDDDDDDDDDGWTWHDMEKERLRGLRLASHFDALNECHKELRGGDVLGEFGDYW